jgi:hypothetical protein
MFREFLDAISEERLIADAGVRWNPLIIFTRRDLESWIQPSKHPATGADLPFPYATGFDELAANSVAAYL